MNRYFVVISALILAGCDSQVSTPVVDLPQKEAVQISDSEITDLRTELEATMKSTAELKIDFEAKKTELVSKIDAAKAEHDAIRAIQAAHYLALEKEMEKAAQELKEANDDMAIWDPIKLESVSVMRDEMIKMVDENRALKAEIERLKQARP